MSGWSIRRPSFGESFVHGKTLENVFRAIFCHGPATRGARLLSNGIAEQSQYSYDHQSRKFITTR